MPYGSSPLTAAKPPSPPPSTVKTCCLLTNSSFDSASFAAISVHCLESCTEPPPRRLALKRRAGHMWRRPAEQAQRPRQRRAGQIPSSVPPRTKTQSSVRWRIEGHYGTDALGERKTTECVGGVTRRKLAGLRRSCAASASRRGLSSHRWRPPCPSVHWVPAFAGMTPVESAQPRRSRHPREGGDPDHLITRELLDVRTRRDLPPPCVTAIDLLGARRNSA